MRHARSDYQNRITDTLPADKGGIPTDEPVFLIRAKDKLAARVVRYWAELAEVEGVDDEMIALVRGLAREMEDWPEQKTPDMPKASKARKAK